MQPTRSPLIQRSETPNVSAMTMYSSGGNSSQPLSNYDMVAVGRGQSVCSEPFCS